MDMDGSKIKIIKNSQMILEFISLIFCKLFYYVLVG